MDGSGHDESSSSRRERLLALRSAANAPPPPPPSAAPSPSLLPDPDLAGDPDQSAARQPHRFDYYTNPAAAFSSSSGGGGGGNPHKRKSPPACYAPPLPQPYAEPGNYGLPHYHHILPLPIHYPSLMQPGSMPWQSPMQFQTSIGHDEPEESSSSRRQRLLALRPAANAPPPSAAPAPSLLPDPDLAGDPDQSAARQPHRFDYYTNPGAAFSSSSYSGSGGGNPHKRKSPPPRLPQPYGSGSNYPPPNHHHMGPSPINTPSAMHQDAPGSRPWRNPMQYQDRISGYQGAPVTPPWGPHFGSAGRGSYTNSSDFGFRHPNPGGGGSPMNYYRPRGSPHTSYGRGRGQNYNSSPGSWGRGGRGGVGFQNNSGQDCRSYFNKSMVYDPWQDLQPIVGNILIPRGGSRSWLPESLREKKETSAHDQIKSTSSGMSLAEYLDLSFNEACSEK